MHDIFWGGVIAVAVMYAIFFVIGWLAAAKVKEGSAADLIVAGRNMPLWIATLTNAIQVHPDVAVRKGFAGALGVETLTYPDERVRRFAERENIPFVSLVEPLADLAARDGVYLHGFPGAMGKGHWNETGNRVAGETLALGICQSWRPGGASESDRSLQRAQ